MKNEIKTNKHMNHVAINDGYNVCPECGRQAYAVMTEDRMYRVGCLHCGLVYGIGTFVEDDVTDEMTENMRRRWNEKCLGADEYSVEALEVIDAREGDYVMVDAQTKEIICIAGSVANARQYVLDHYDKAVDIYLLGSGSLEKMGCSFLVQALTKN